MALKINHWLWLASFRRNMDAREWLLSTREAYETHEAIAECNSSRISSA